MQVRVDLTVYDIEWTNSAVTANVSHSGMFVVGDRPPPAGTTVRFVMDLKEGKASGFGVVVWTRLEHTLGKPAGMGIEFRSFVGHDRFLLSRALHEFQFGTELLDRNSEGSNSKGSNSKGSNSKGSNSKGSK